MKTRIYFLDHLRTLLILLVVVLHSGLVYEHVLQNSWIVVDTDKANSIGLIRLYLDLFIMFSIFFIAGFFAAKSVRSKETITFIKSKLKRLMLPWLIAVFTLIPAYKFIFLYSRGLPQEEWFSYFHFFQRTGSDLSFYANNPAQNWLWFLPVLFLFELIYLALYKSKLLNFKISLKTGVLLTFVGGLAYSLLISELGLVGWYDSALLHFQRERLLVYFMSFLLGTLCYKLRVFESSAKNRRLYIGANIVLSLSVTVFTATALNLFFNLIDPTRNFYFVSPFVDRLLYYASALVSQLSVLYVLLYGFRHSFDKTNALLSELNRNSYAVYIIHTIVLGVIAIGLSKLAIAPFLKFGLLSVSTFALSNLLIYSWRQLVQHKLNATTVATGAVAMLLLLAAFSPQHVENEVDESSPVKASGVPTDDTQSLHAAVISGDLQVMERLIASGADLNQAEPAGGSSPLITAAMFGKTDIALALIDAGADLNYTNNDGSTALHSAAFFCRTEIVKALLSHGAKIDLVNNSGSTALQSVQVPFEMVKPVYAYFGNIYEPLGLKLDMSQLEKTRPQIAQLLEDAQ